DSIVVAQQPKLAPYILKMRERIAEILDIDFDLVSVKATTEEGLGLVGSEQGIAAYAVVGIER
ncbi:MAG: 2-C-methyl-D-erythritol 2,4-cyclodiphosphate synthase, partial [Selenomonadaceae bacterium]|nr:2-C-methyl-D-erythritol 2,4-cyclodiphosphate synthase [Selenomonadaceae bacterium]